MDFWRLLQLYTWNDGGWILLYIFSILVIYQSVKTHRQRMKVIFFVSIAGFIFFNPFFARITFQHIFPSYKEYSRVSWLLFIPVIVSVAVAELVSVKNNRRKLLVWGSYLLILMIFSTATIPKLIVWPSNIYKINQGVLDVAESLVSDISEYDYNEQDRTVLEEKDSRPRVLIQSEKDVGHSGDLMYYGIRQYTSKVNLTQVIISSEEYGDSKFELYTYGVTNYQYFICQNQNNLVSQAEQYGFNVLFKSDEYVLLKNTKSFSLYFIRHGQTDANVAGVYAGLGTNAMLTTEGIEQTKKTGEALSSIEFTDSYASELTRSQDTANNILGENRNDIPELQIREYLDDFYWGDIEGMTTEEVINRYPDFTLDGYIGSATDSTFISPIHSWSKCDTQSRYRWAFNQIASEATDGGNTLVVGHSAMIWYFQQMFPEQVSEDAGLDNASITILHYDRGRWTLEYLNLSAEEYEELGL